MDFFILLSRFFLLLTAMIKDNPRNDLCRESLTRVACKAGGSIRRFDRTLSVVLKTLSLWFYRTFSGANWGSIEPCGVRYRIFLGRSIEPFGGFLSNLLGTFADSGYCFQTPSSL